MPSQDTFSFYIENNQYDDNALINIMIFKTSRKKISHSVVLQTFSFPHSMAYSQINLLILISKNLPVQGKRCPQKVIF